MSFLKFEIKINNIRLLVALVLLSALTSSCTLRKRNPAPKDDSKKEDSDENKKTDAEKKTDTTSDTKPNTRPATETPGGTAPPSANNNDSGNTNNQTQNKRWSGEGIPDNQSNNSNSTSPQSKSNSKNNLVYTDSGSDDLIESLRTELDKEISNQEDIRKKAQIFAKSIVDVKVTDKKRSQAQVEIKISNLSNETDNNLTTTIVLKGSNNRENNGIALTENNKSNSNIKGFLECIDAETHTNCSTYKLQLFKKDDKQEIPATIAIRNLKAKFDLLTSSETEIKNEPLKDIADLFQNDGESDNYFLPRYTILQSFSVIDGKSQFQLHLETNNGDFINIGGPLLTSVDDNNPMSVNLTKNLPFITPLPTQAKAHEKSENQTAENVEQSNNDLSKNFESAMLKSNDGRGNLVVDLIGKANSENSDTAEKLTFRITTTPLNIKNSESNSKN